MRNGAWVLLVFLVLVCVLQTCLLGTVVDGRRISCLQPGSRCFAHLTCPTVWQIYLEHLALVEWYPQNRLECMDVR